MSVPYNKLAERCIRLLDLYPGELNSPFRGRLRPTGLDIPEFYEALSYTWGSPETAAFLHCESGSLPLTLNLVQALLRLRRTDTIRTLWIDQICINQDDEIERGQQVGLMGGIYRGASIVDIWLGEED
ncbi:HET-domain-containing protein, partial [Mollisia scopiformis]